MIRLVAMFLAIAVALGAAADERAIAALVNGSPIDAERLERWFEGEFLPSRGRSVAAIRSPAVYRRLKREALEALVTEELLWQEARRRHRIATAPDVQAEMVRMRATAGSPEALARALERRGVRPEQLAEDVRRRLSIARLVADHQASAVALPVDLLVAELRARAEVRLAPWASGDTDP